jgi:hypothetical protein
MSTPSESAHSRAARMILLDAGSERCLGLGGGSCPAGVPTSLPARAREETDGGAVTPRRVVRLVADDGVAEHEVALRRDGHAGERGRQRVESGIEDRDPHARARDPGIRQRAQVKLAIRHLGRAVGGVAARGAGVDRGRGQLGRAVRPHRLPPAPDGLQMTQDPLPGQDGQDTGWNLGAHRVQPPTGDPDRRSGALDAPLRLRQRCLASHEDPHRDGCIPGQHPSERR